MLSRHTQSLLRMVAADLAASLVLVTRLTYMASTASGKQCCLRQSPWPTMLALNVSDLITGPVFSSIAYVHPTSIYGDLKKILVAPSEVVLAEDTNRTDALNITQR